MRHGFGRPFLTCVGSAGARLASHFTLPGMAATRRFTCSNCRVPSNGSSGDTVIRGGLCSGGTLGRPCRPNRVVRHPFQGIKVHSTGNREIELQLRAIDHLCRQLGELYELQPIPAAPTGDYAPGEWTDWRAAVQHAYGVREGLLIAMTVGAAAQTALHASVLEPRSLDVRMAADASGGSRAVQLRGSRLPAGSGARY